MTALATLKRTAPSLDHVGNRHTTVAETVSAGLRSLAGPRNGATRFASSGVAKRRSGVFSPAALARIA